MKLSRLKDDYLTSLRVENKSPHTIENYTRYLKVFLDWLNQEKPKKITEQKINEFQLHLADTGMGINSRSYHITVLKNFLRYCKNHDIKMLSPDKIKTPKLERKKIDFLDKNEIIRLLNTPELCNDKSELVILRDKAILELLFSTGLRVSELVSLNISDVQNFEISIKGKGNKTRLVFISNAAKFAIDKYLDLREKNIKYRGYDSLFVGIERRTDRLSPRSIQRIVMHYSDLAGIKKIVTPHTLRHSFATDLLTNGANIRSVQEILGHSRVTTTQLYTHVTNTRLQEVFAKCHTNSLQFQQT